MGPGPAPTYYIGKMNSATSAAAERKSCIENTENPKNWEIIKQKTLGIQNKPIREALQSIANLRRYILTEHPHMLKDAGTQLVQAEAEIFTIYGQFECMQIQ